MRNDKKLDLAIQYQIMLGAIPAILLVVVLGGWAHMTEIDSAVIAPATVVVESSKKTVQHDAGGIIERINVRDGDRVRKGDVLFRLDGTQLAANISALEKRHFDYSVRKLRLEAERRGDKVFALSDELKRLLLARPELAEIVVVQSNLLAARLDVQSGKRKQLEERITQLSQQITGLEEIRSAIADELALFAEELESLSQLKDKQLVNLARFSLIKRQQAEKRGVYGQTVADIAKTKAQIGETRLQIIDITDTARNELLKELEALEAELTQIAEQLRAARDQEEKLDIRASDNGHVHELVVHTEGGVIKPGEVLAYIVPSDTGLVVDANVQTIDRDQIYPGMTARVQFTAFSQRSTPQLYGRIERVASDQSTGPDGRVPPYYAVRIKLLDGEMKRLDGLDIVAGMPAEVMMTARPRTVLSYLMKPMTDQFNRAFRDE
jgi:HlyD family secretion protein